MSKDRGPICTGEAQRRASDASWERARRPAATDGNGRGRSPSSVDWTIAQCDNDVDILAHEICGQVRKSLNPSLGREIFEDDALPLDIAHVAQPLAKRSQHYLGRG